MIINYPVLKDETALDFLRDFGLSKSKIYTLFLENRIKINQKPCGRETLLKLGDVISITESEEIDFPCDNKKLDIIYEDAYLLIVNKPAHLLVHPDDKKKNGTLCNVVANYYKNRGYDLTVKYAHRLDMDTTGILIFCKDMLCMSRMNQMISRHIVKRYYLAFVGGRLAVKKGSIDLPIGEDRHHNSRRRVSATGQRAVTHYEVIKEYSDFSLVKILLETGRTHQIRVHFSYIGHPLLGDALYYGSCQRIKRTALHSYKVEFCHPITGEAISLTKDLPYDMRLLEENRNASGKICK